MQLEAPASDLERRKQVRLRLRGDLSITPQKYEGRTYYVVKDPVSLRYYRFTEQEHFLLEMMVDGRHTLDEAQKAFEERFRPDRMELEDVESFGHQLLTAGLVQNESPGVGKLLYERHRKRRRNEWIQTLTNILYIKIPLFDPERLLGRMAPYCRFIFTPWFALFSVVFILSAILLVLTHFQTFRDRLPSFHEFFSFRMMIYLWAALGVVKIIHEFGHGISCKTFGGEVHEMGLLFLCFSPAMYCNVSDAWILPSKWQRMIIGFAGIYVELMIAALATFIWWNSPGQPFLNNMALSLMVVCSVSTVVFNGNPLMRYDGYYVLSDWLEIPNLRDRSNRFLKWLVTEYCLGIEQDSQPYMARGRQLLFVAYAVISYIYRWVITFIILAVIATFLKPYKLQVISNMLALAAAASMVGWPLYRLGRSLHRRGRLPDMKPVRTTVSATVVAVLLLVFFFVPLPVYFNQVRQTGLVQVRPDALTPVHLKVPGILEKLHVREGQRVEKGAVLATFTSLDLQQQEAAARAEYNIRHRMVETYKAQLEDVSDPEAIRKLELAKAKAQGDLDEAQQKLREIQEMARLGLQLIAPRAGIVMGLPQMDDIGKRFLRDQTTPFCLIGDPTQLRVLVPVTPDDYELIRANRKRQRVSGRELAVTIRVQGLGGRTWEGRLSQLPESEAKEVPAALSSRAGGPLAVKAGSAAGQLTPQNQVYLIGVDFLQADPAICPGQLARVKIHTSSHSLAWWTWRALSRTFDLGLL
jgi:putative peptide zinc metalloprotease protein